MDKKEIKDYLKRVDKLGAKLVGEDKGTYTWLIYGYNQCAKLLNETEQQCKKQKEVINKAIEKINDYKIYCEENKGFTEYTDIEIEAIEPVISEFEDILKEVSE